jgi:O-antigen/teichoic acid export membrane protein
MNTASLARSSGVYLAAAALSAAIPFVALPLLTRWLGPHEFGLAATYLALVNAAAVVAGLSAHGVISVVHFRTGPEEVPAYVGACLRVLGITLLPLLAALVMFAEPLQRASGIAPAWTWTVAVAASAQFVMGIGMAVWQARTQPVRVGTVQVGFAGGWAALSLALIGAADWGWQGRAAGQVVAATALAAWTLWLLRHEGLLHWHAANGTPLRAVLRFGLPLLPHALAATLMSSADRLILFGLAGADAAGQYFAAFQIAAALSVAAAAVNQAWVPWLYRRLAAPTPAASAEAVMGTYAVYAGLLAAAALIAVNATWIVTSVAGTRFEQAAGALRWLAPAAALSGMYYFVANYLFFAGRTGVLSWITVGCAGLQVGLILLLVPRFGIEGAAAAAFIAMFGYWAATWMAAQRLVPMPWSLRTRARVVPAAGRPVAGEGSGQP